MDDLVSTYVDRPALWDVGCGAVSECCCMLGGCDTVLAGCETLYRAPGMLPETGLVD